MIRVLPQPEPHQFQALVRTPGRRFLRSKPHPKSKDFKGREYWRAVLPELHASYNGVCAYACHWIPYDTGSDTVEHFKSKVRNPPLAYEWTNYRLVCGTLNGRKRDYKDVLDPFEVRNGEFILDFPSLEVNPSQQLLESRKKKVQKTIDRLQLNDEGTCLKSRVQWVRDYCDAEISFSHLVKRAPFVAMELMRQNLVLSIKQMMDVRP